VITRRTTLVLPRPLMERLRAHLFPGDGLEAAGLLLCGSAAGRRQKLLGRDWLPVPHKACQRYADYITWPGEYVEKAIAKAEANGLSIIAVHSHPGGLFAFSDADESRLDALALPRHGSGLRLSDHDPRRLGAGASLQRRRAHAADRSGFVCRRRPLLLVEAMRQGRGRWRSRVG
jgi:proteasome lid subunit RPN8/RPN11